MSLGTVTPILRLFDETMTREFYVDFLGFQVDWEHRFEGNFPLYMQVSRDGCLLQLSGHFGDCCPGAAIRITTTDVDAYQAELLAKQYKHARPGVTEAPWGGREMSIQDPAGNRLTFYNRDPEISA